MSNNPGYAQGKPDHEHERQMSARERKNVRRAVANGEMTPRGPRQYWDQSSMSWIKEDR